MPCMFFVLILFLVRASVFAAEPINQAQGVARDLQVSITAVVRQSQIELSFDRSAVYTIWRKPADATNWGDSVEQVTGASWTDKNPEAGKLLEYRVRCADTKREIYGYCISGVNVDQTGWRGKIILLMADDIQVPLAKEIEQLKLDLVGDGWTPVPLIVPSLKGWTDQKQAPGIRAKVKSAYELDPKNTKLLFLLGHVPVPRSGSATPPPYPPDGHCYNTGAHPADCYYAELYGEWTDQATLTEFDDRRFNKVSAGKLGENFRNLPGDGKFDQEYIPHDVVLGYGRVDMRDLSAGEELGLLRRYLEKDHKFRHAALDPQFASAEGRCCVIRDGMLSCGSHAWESFPGLVGWSNIQFLREKDVPDGDERYVAQHGPYLFYARGNGVPARGDGGKAAFWLGFQSGVPYWGEAGNSMREAVAGNNYSLGFICTPYAIRYPLHRLAMGLPLGDVIKEGINNAHELKDPGTGYQATPSWGELYQGQLRRVLFNLVGDPSLTLYHFPPASEALARRKGNAVTISWTASPDTAVTGYHIWRAEALDGTWTRLTPTIVTTTKYNDDAPPAHSAWYMVRAIKMEHTGSGPFLSAAQGVFARFDEHLPNE